MSKGRTQNCREILDSLPATTKAIADAAEVNDASVRRFKNGSHPIRRTTFNKIAFALKENWGVDVPAQDHFIEVLE